MWECTPLSLLHPVFLKPEINLWYADKADLTQLLVDDEVAIFTDLAS